MEKTRSEYVAKNIMIAIMVQLANIFISFINRTVFIKVLGIEYLGVGSLFVSILAVLSLAELGIGNAIVFSMYTPLVKKDVDKLKSLTMFYKKAYRIVVSLIFVLGLCAIPFLYLIIRDIPEIRENITIIYLLFLLNTMMSYVYIFKSAIITADQKEYIVSYYRQFIHIASLLVQTTVLIITHSFYLYLVIAVLFTLANNICISLKAQKMYPFLKHKEVEPLGKEEKQDIKSNIRALFAYKVGARFLGSIDSIVISIIFGLTQIGIYANYSLLINVFKNLGDQIMNSILASFGNLNATENSDKVEKTFYSLLFVCAWMFGFFASGLYLFLNYVIEIWIGSNYLMNSFAVFAICLVYYVSEMHYPLYIYRNSAGLFVHGKHMPIIASVLNLVLNFILGYKIGIAGIFIATCISRLMIYETVDTYLVYKYVFKQKPFRYYLKYFLYFSVIAIDCLLMRFVLSFVNISGFVGLVCKINIMIIMYNLIFIAVFIKTKEMKSLFQFGKFILTKLRKNTILGIKYSKL